MLLTSAAVALLLATPSASAAPRAAAADIAIDHGAVGCAVAGMHPKFRACVRARRASALPRIYFRGAGGRSWHYVEMARETGSCFEGVLPRPLADLARFEYYVVAREAKPPFAEAQTPVHSVDVRPPSVGCSTPFETRTRVRVFAADGPARSPLGFDGTGVSSLTKDRPNRPSRLLIAGGAAAVAGVAVVLGTSGGDEPALTPTPPPAAALRSTTSAPAHLHVVLNGQAGETLPPSAVFHPRLRGGVNHLEATRVADGAPGTWTLALGPDVRLKTGTLRVVAGTVVAQDERTVVVRLGGGRGERIVVRFEIGD